MIAILVLSSLFLTTILIFAIILIANLKNTMSIRDKWYQGQIKQMKEELSEIKSLFKNEISDVFNHFKKINNL